MILGCHEALDEAIAQHRQADLARADQAVVSAAEGCGLTGVYARLMPEWDPERVRRAFLRPAEIDMYFATRGRQGTTRSAIEDDLDRLDLAPLTAALAARRALMDEISAQRREMVAADYPRVESAFDVPCPGTLATEVRWADGRPRTVFHVTAAEFDRFKPVSHFGSALAVSRHADRAWRYGRDGEDVRVVAAWLDIKRPLRIADDGQMSVVWMVAAARAAGALTLPEAAAVLGVGAGDFDAGGSLLPGRIKIEAFEVEEAFAAALLDKGWDGLVYANRVEGGGDSWVTLRADQVHVAREWRYAPRRGQRSEEAAALPAPR